MGVEPVSVSVCVCISLCVLTLSIMNISEAKVHLKHYGGEGKAALGFGPDWIRTLVFMRS